MYHVNIGNYRNARLYGILCVPRKEGKYPALLQVPGAGGWPHIFAEISPVSHRKPEKIQTSYYYDVVNFAWQVKVPGY